MKHATWVRLVGLAMFIALVATMPGCGDDAERDRSSRSEIDGGTDAVSSGAATVPAQGDPFAAIAAAGSADDLQAFLDDRDPRVAAAAVRRLGQVAGPDAVEPIRKAFDAVPRRASTRSDPVKPAAIEALGQIGTPEAAGQVRSILDDYLAAGPATPGPYSHIYDTQHYAVVRAAIQATGGFEGDAATQRLQQIRDDESLFYTVRQAAAQALLRRGMPETDQAAWLIKQIRPEGVLIEKQWTGLKPGDKTAAAIAESAVEAELVALGPEAIGPLANLATGGEDDAHRFVAARTLGQIILDDRAAAAPAIDDERAQQALSAAMQALDNVSPTGRQSPTAVACVRFVTAAANELGVQALQQRASRLAGQIGDPDSWKGQPPTNTQLGVALPAGCQFVPLWSRQVESPHGSVLRACYLVDADPDAVAEHFQRITRVDPTVTTNQGVNRETRRFFAFGQTPKELEGLVTAGILVANTDQPYRVEQPGQPAIAGRTLIVITRIGG